MLRDHSTSLYRLLFASEVVLSALLLLLLIASTGVTPVLRGEGSDAAELLVLGSVACLAWPLTLRRLRLHASQRRRLTSQILSQLLASGLICTVLVAATAFAVSAPLPRYFPVAFGAVQLVVLAGLRLGILGGLRLLRRRGRNYRNIVIIGSGPRAQRIRKAIALHPEWGLRIIAFLDEGEPAPNGSGERPPEIHKFADLSALSLKHGIDEVIVGCPRSMLADIGPVVEACAEVGIPVTVPSDLFGDYLPPPQVTRFDSIPALSFAPVHHRSTMLSMKRALDVAGAAAALAVSAPLMGVAALLIKLGSPGPVFFRQTRCGLNGRRFQMLKLRTMCVDAEERRDELLAINEMSGPVFKIERDPRLTPLGHLLRRWSVDELPQFWNVLRGDMSLVGPRPPIPAEVERYERFQRRRLSMRPGITCLWQVSGRNRIGFADWVRLDLEYIDGWSLSKDIKILLRTIPAVLRGTGAS